ncbi:caspase domain-containing protein [Earliella scabrosa]|nr:caspase domain-containing protein [Earliella scabrosa]
MVKIGPRFIPRRRSTPQGPPPKLALLIGIDYVDPPHDPDYGPLRRARSDTKDFRDLLIIKYDYRPENIVMMLDGDGTEAHLQPTRANILREIRRLVHGAQDGSRFVFFYSGHSGQLENPNSDEEDGMDEFLVPVDYAQHPDTHVKKRVILDNKLRKMLVDPLPVGASLTAIFDSCHSGTLLDLDHYLCNNVYYPWTNVGRRRYMTKWLNVRRKDGQRMSQSGVKVITKKHPPRDNSSKAAAGNTSSAPTRENSACSVRIYQRKRLSDKEMGIFDTSVDITSSQDGERSFSVQSRRTSVQLKPSLSLAQVLEGAQSMDSLDEDGEVLGGPRCASPTSMRTCNGFCEADDKPPGGGTVLSISSCQDSQITWESKKGTFTQWLVELLRLDPHQPIGKFLKAITYKMYDHAQNTHEFSHRMKAKYRREHPLEEPGSSTGSSTVTESASGGSGTSATDVSQASGGGPAQRDDSHPLDAYEYSEIPEPQLGGQRRIDLAQPVML